jgi:hypothetical protein
MRAMLIKSYSWWVVSGNRQCRYPNKRLALRGFRNCLDSNISEHETVNMEIASKWPESMVIKSKEVA